MTLTDEPDGGFHELVGSLPTLLLSTSDLEGFLTEVAVLAARSVNMEPMASCGITTRYDQQALTVALSDARAGLIDEQQYSAGEGPCLEAMRTGTTTDMPDVVHDPRWPAFRAAAVGYQLRCVLSVPLFDSDKPLGALNLYGFGRTHAFGVEQIQRASIFAARASTALTLHLRHLEQTELTDQLEQAIASRSVVDQAIGVLMREQQCDARTAFSLLRSHSQNNNRKLREVAADVIERMTGHPHSSPASFQRHFDLPATDPNPE